ncbi:MAG: hypothetical protein P4L55_23460 [Syntrophobacteraceae bacterium]|nr:hypothetical protein [Syntrophobacteraceae bacterium]
MAAMMRNIGFIILAFTLAPMGVLHAGGLTVTPKKASVELGKTAQFTITATNPSGGSLTWSVAGIHGGNSTVGTISSTGLYSAPASLPRQNPVKISAKSGGKSASVPVRLLTHGPAITSVSPNPLPVGKVTITIKGSGFLKKAVVLDTSQGRQVTLTTVSVSPETIVAKGYQGPSASASFCVLNPGSVVSNSLTVPIAFTLKVVQGSGSGAYAAGSVVRITANAAAAGQQFSKWTGAAVADPTKASTTLTMPAADTTVTANYAPLPATHKLTVVNGAGSGAYPAGSVVRVTANAPAAGQQFSKWTGAVVADPTKASTTLTMPAADTTVTANYSTLTSTLQLTGATLPNATQLKPYTAPALTATGGTPPYTWSVTSSADTLPEGMTIGASTGVISSTAVGGQGGYYFQVQVVDAANHTATAGFVINVAGDSTYGGCNIFPPNSIFHHRVDLLPVDTSPAAPIYSAYQSSHLRVFFGNDAGPPNGIPFIRVPWNQPSVNVTFNQYPSESDPGPYPIPPNAPIEGTADSTGDRHVLVLQMAGNGQPCKLYETWETIANGNGTWTAANGAYWDLGSNDLRPLTWTSGDAAGLPIMPLTVNYDEVSNGTINHPIRFTVNHMLANFVWPARHSAGTGTCTESNGSTLYNSLISQATPPASCTMTGPAGEIYRLKANIDISVCSNSPQATAILKAMKEYGIIIADNGMTGGLIGTPDARWDNSDLACLTNFTLSQFEPVNVSSLQIKSDSGQTPSTSSGNAAQPGLPH